MLETNKKDSSKYESNFKLALEAINNVKLVLSLGSGNRKSDENNSSFQLALLNIAQAMEECATFKSSNLDAKYEETIPEKIKVYKKAKAGNCEGQTLIAYDFLKNKGSEDIAVCAILESNHWLLLIDKQIICDPWGGAVYPIDDFEVQRKKFMDFEYSDRMKMQFMLEGKEIRQPLDGYFAIIYATKNSASDSKSYEIIADRINSNYKNINFSESKKKEMRAHSYAFKNMSNPSVKTLYAPSTMAPHASFNSSSQKTLLVPEELKHALKDGNVKEYLTKQKTTIEQLIDLQENKAWVIGALRCSNIREGIYNNFVTVEQLSQLTKTQVIALKHKFSGSILKSKVEEFLLENQKITLAEEFKSLSMNRCG